MSGETGRVAPVIRSGPIVVGAVAGVIVALLFVAYFMVLAGLSNGWEIVMSSIALNIVLTVPFGVMFGIFASFLADNVRWTTSWWAFGLTFGLVFGVTLGTPLLVTTLWNPPVAVGFVVLAAISCLGSGLLIGRYAMLPKRS